MAVYCIDDGGDGSQTNTTQSATTLDWSKADASVADLISYDATAFTTSGNIIYFGDDHNDPNKAANWTLTGPTSGAPVLLISADRTQATATYKAGSGTQLSSLGGAYTMTLDGSFACHGIRMDSGSHILLAADSNEALLISGCKFYPAADCYLSLSSYSLISINCTVDGTADGSTGRSTEILRIGSADGQIAQVYTMHFANVAYRTGNCIRVMGGFLYGSGIDFSGFTNATTCEIFYGGLGSGRAFLTHCKTKSGPTYFSAVANTNNCCRAELINVGSADDPSICVIRDYYGELTSTTVITRTGGASFESTANSWLIGPTTAYCTEDSPFYTPWRYGTISSTGSKTFTMYIVNDTADFKNDEVWLEVEYFATSNEGKSTYASSQRASKTATAAANVSPCADDTTSTWNGTGPSFTYKQSLAVTATVNEDGQYRCRVAVGVASIAGSRYFYVDPKVTVS